MSLPASERSAVIALVGGFVAATREENLGGQADHEIRHYYSYLGDGGTAEARRHLRYIDSLVALSGHAIPGSTILDVGCAYGLNVLVLALLGARKSLGIELQHKCVVAFDALRQRLLPGSVDRAEVRTGDAAHLPVADDSVDVILAMECVSHILEVERFFGEAHRVLRGGGAVVIADSNNGSNPWVRWRRRRLWDVAENGPPGRSVGDYVCTKPYRELRAEILRESFPDLSEFDVALLARNTFGMNRYQILEAARLYRLSGLHPGRTFVPGTCAVNPTRGYCLENVFQPFALAKRLEAFGFECRAYPYFGGARGGWVAAGNRLLSRVPRLTMGLAKAYRLVARKPAA
jgi:SAM-dependent methyltransferase